MQRRAFDVVPVVAVAAALFPTLATARVSQKTRVNYRLQATTGGF